MSLAETISQAALPGNAWALDEISAVLARIANVFQVKIGGRRTIKEVVESSGYTYYDHTILDGCKLVGGRERAVTIEIFSIEHFDHDPTDDEIEAEYVRCGLERPDADHGVHTGEQRPDLPQDGHPIIFYLKNPVSGAAGRRSVLALWRHGAGRGLRWDRLVPRLRWPRCCRFAGVRK